jgi:hypothetical protein
MRRVGLAVVVACLGLNLRAAENAPTADDPLSERADQAIAALQARLGVEVRVLRVSVRPEEVELDAQDPREPAHVDRYVWQEDGLTGPEPLAVGRNLRQLKAQLFPVSDVRLEVLRLGVSEAVVATETEGGRVTHALIERDSYAGEYGDGWTVPQVRVYVEGPRGGGFLQRNVDGKRRRVVRW